MNAWVCDRCGAVTRDSDGNQKEGSWPPLPWRYIAAPVRGSEGARSTRQAVICGVCDDSLYDWFRREDG